MTYSLIVIVLYFLPFVVVGQQQKPKAEIISKSEVPYRVLEAVSEDFPKAEVKDYVRIPQDMYDLDWGDDVVFKTRGPAPDLYRVKLKGKYSKRDLIYNEEGKLLWSDQKDKYHELPLAVNQAIAQEYGSGVIFKNKHFVNPNSEIPEYYKVKVRSDNYDTHVVWVEPNGNIFKSYTYD
ncbi:hypothetical protein [Sediminitomix flava]|uniref:Uncharacterized protein n=1 Tax=Sediminitomix flava TaxID=379075 RepID=A0A315ZAG6_SEDFL|nr:hypothetical protein [Sediminitomix flava]PWJ42149.1 hypothetical protein BC781_103399 [Sediminitomix flava]